MFIEEVAGDWMHNKGNSIRQPRSLPLDGSNACVIVPAELVERSRPCGHSVPIIRMKQKLQRLHPYRSLMVVSLICLGMVFAAILAVYDQIQAQRDAGYQLVCQQRGCTFKRDIDTPLARGG
jgi:hypothetical protein